MKHSHRAKQNLTDQLKTQLGFLQRDLGHEKKSLIKAKSYQKWNLPGIKSMISQHERGVKKTLADVECLKTRIKRRYTNGGALQDPLIFYFLSEKTIELQCGKSKIIQNDHSYI